jgi:hypothetical protein
MEKAEQNGDANAWIGLWSRETVSNAEKMRPYIRPRPNVHYKSSTTYVQGDEAVLLGQSSEGPFLGMRFVQEDGRWKIKDQVWNNKAYPANSVYAMIPPPPGAFERDGAQWQNVAPALDQADAARRGWQVRATFDESFLYVRMESSKPFPAPGSQAETPPSGWPVMKAGVSGIGEFVLYASADIGDQATFDQGGRANSHRHFVAYSLRLERAGQSIFEANAGLHPDPLVQVGDQFFEVRVPLRTMGVADARHTRILIGDAQRPKSAIFSLEVPQYR